MRKEQIRVYRTQSGEVESIKYGWSWAAFAFGPIWGLSKSVTSIALVFIMLDVVIWYFVRSEVSNDAAVSLLCAEVALFQGLTFGTWGNVWRERKLRYKGFHLSHVVRMSNTRRFIAWPRQFEEAWLDPVWSKVIGAVLVAIPPLLYTTLYSKVDLELDSVPIEELYSPTCTAALLEARVITNASEVEGWFEWGESARLGEITPRVKADSSGVFVFQLVRLSANTTYYYRSFAVHANGQTVGPVRRIVTPEC